MKVDVRFANPEDGARLAEISAATGFSVLGEFDWSRVDPYWLVAEIDGRVEAMIQLLVGQPTSRLDWFLADPKLSKKRRGAAVLKLSDYAAAIVKRFGSPILSSSIDMRLESYLRVAENRGWTVLSTAWDVVRRIE